MNARHGLPEKSQFKKLKALSSAQLLASSGFRKGYEDARAGRPADPAMLDNKDGNAAWNYERGRLVVLDMRRLGIEPPPRIRALGEKRQRFLPELVAAWNAYWKLVRERDEPQAYS